MTTSRDDLTIDERLRDPATHAIRKADRVKADRVDPSEPEAMMHSMAPEIAPFDRSAPSRFLRSVVRRRGETPQCIASGSSIRSQLCGAA
jgi:hypothetical protein